MIKREFQIYTTQCEEMNIIRRWAKNSPETIKIMLKYPEGDCPFPEDCKKFPCKTLNCNSDSCENGFTHRRS